MSARRHVAPLVPCFRELHPEVTISLNLSDREVDTLFRRVLALAAPRASE